MSKMRIHEIEIRDADIFEILLDNFPDMIHSIDEDGQIVYTNKTAELLLGYTQDEFLSMNVRQIYADEILEALEKGFSDLKEKGDKEVESLLKAKDGTVIPVEIRSFSIYDDEGNFLRTFSILRDIRAFKELQQSLFHAGRLAAIGELASGVAHDINNPLTVIQLSNEMVMREVARMPDSGDNTSAERISSFARDIQKASKSIQKLSEHLRNFSRGMVEQYEPIDLVDVIADAFFITKSKLNEVGVGVTNDVAAGEYYVMGSANNLEQVFVNLIGNACDAMAGRDIRDLTVTVSSAERDDVEHWRCDITDTGGGVPDDLAEDIFQSFFTTKEKGKGTGLGLSISRGIVKDHKGDLVLTSEAGKGSTFSVYLPKVDINA